MQDGLSGVEKECFIRPLIGKGHPNLASSLSVARYPQYSVHHDYE